MPQTLPILVTPRLTLRPPLEVDLEAIARGLSDFEVARWLGTVPHPYTLADARHWLERMERGPDDRRWCVHDAHGFVGVVSLRRRDFAAFEDTMVLGYWFARFAWGRGIGTEAVRAALARHFAEGGVDVVAGAHEGNVGSLAIQARMGFEPVGDATEHSLAQGREVPVAVNRLTAQAFAARHPDRAAA